MSGVNGSCRRRYVIKISGEALGGAGKPWDQEKLDDIARWLKEVKERFMNLDIALVVGGGNFARGRELSMIPRTDADSCGMLATMMNALYLASFLRQQGLPVVGLSKVVCESLIDSYTPRRASNHLEKGRIVILGGGTGNALVTTDTATVTLARELECGMIIKGTNVDGIYTKDPKVDPNATRIPYMSYEDAVNNPDCGVMDKEALGGATTGAIPIIVCRLDYDSMLAAISGELVGTFVGTPEAFQSRYHRKP